VERFVVRQRGDDGSVGALRFNTLSRRVGQSKQRVERRTVIRRCGRSDRDRQARWMRVSLLGKEMCPNGRAKTFANRFAVLACRRRQDDDDAIVPVMTDDIALPENETGDVRDFAGHTVDVPLPVLFRKPLPFVDGGNEHGNRLPRISRGDGGPSRCYKLVVGEFGSGQWQFVELRSRSAWMPQP
jgi:hypothetical protein